MPTKERITNPYASGFPINVEKISSKHEDLAVLCLEDPLRPNEFNSLIKFLQDRIQGRFSLELSKQNILCAVWYSQTNGNLPMLGISSDGRRLYAEKKVYSLLPNGNTSMSIKIGKMSLPLTSLQEGGFSISPGSYQDRPIDYPSILKNKIEKEDFHPYHCVKFEFPKPLPMEIWEQIVKEFDGSNIRGGTGHWWGNHTEDDNPSARPKMEKNQILHFKGIDFTEGRIPTFLAISTHGKQLFVDKAWNAHNIKTVLEENGFPFTSNSGFDIHR